MWVVFFFFLAFLTTLPVIPVNLDVLHRFKLDNKEFRQLKPAPAHRCNPPVAQSYVDLRNQRGRGKSA